MHEVLKYKKDSNQVTNQKTLIIYTVIFSEKECSWKTGWLKSHL